MKPTFLALTFALAFSLPQFAAAQGSALAVQGLEACAKAFPDGKKAAKAFKALGFTSQGAVQGVETFLDASSKVMVATSTQKSVALRCMATASGLTVADATAMAQAILPMLQGASDTGLSLAGIEAFYTGTMNGKAAGLVIAGPTGDGLGASVTLVLN